MANVLFKKFTRAQFDAITPVATTFYRVTETDSSESLYQGSNKLDRNDLDVSEFALASVSEGVVTIKGIKEIDGAIAVGTSTSNDVVLAKVATSAAAEDLDYDNTASGLTATDVQSAIDEVASQSAGGVDSKTVYAVKTNGGAQDQFAARYTIYQGANGSSSSPVAAEKIIDIDVIKDQFVDDSDLVDITYADGHLYDGVTDVTEIIKGTGGTATAADAGKYIKLIFAQATKNPIYIKVNELIDVYTTEQNASQIQLTIDSNNVISGEIVDGSVDTDALGASAVTTAKIADENVTLGKLASAVQTSLGLADSAVQSVTESDPTTGTDGTFQVDGQEVPIKGLGSAAYQNTSYFDLAGAAAAVAGNSGDAASATTVYGAKAYADAAIATALEWEEVPVSGD